MNVDGRCRGDVGDGREGENVLLLGLVLLHVLRQWDALDLGLVGEGEEGGDALARSGRRVDLVARGTVARAALLPLRQAQLAATAAVQAWRPRLCSQQVAYWCKGIDSGFL